MEVTGNVKSGWRKFYSKTQLPRLAQRKGNYKIKKHDTQERLGYAKAAGRPGS